MRHLDYEAYLEDALVKAYAKNQRLEKLLIGSRERCKRLAAALEKTKPKVHHPPEDELAHRDGTNPLIGTGTPTAFIEKGIDPIY